MFGSHRRRPTVVDGFVGNVLSVPHINSHLMTQGAFLNSLWPYRQQSIDCAHEVPTLVFNQQCDFSRTKRTLCLLVQLNEFHIVREIQATFFEPPMVILNSRTRVRNTKLHVDIYSRWNTFRKWYEVSFSLHTHTHTYRGRKRTQRKTIQFNSKDCHSLVTLPEHKAKSCHRRGTGGCVRAVSYTHLTLPTKLSV